VQHVVQEGLGNVREGCRAMRLWASSFYKVRVMSLAKRRLGEAILKMSHRYPRFGYRRITVMLRREGLEAGKDQVQRFMRREGLQVRKKQHKMKRLGISTSQRRRAEHPGHVWCWDIIQDRTEKGSAFKMLTLMDEYTRQCVCIWPAWSIRAVDVIEQLACAMVRHGEPGHLRSDNGSEFIAYAVQDWLEEKNIKTIYINPGSPWENPYIESFHDKLRDELLNRELFVNLAEARVVTEQWRMEYNQNRPHSSLGYETPNEFAAALPPMGGRGIINKNQARLTLECVH
jgi:transposase InsO family protein